MKSVTTAKLYLNEASLSAQYKLRINVLLTNMTDKYVMFLAVILSYVQQKHTHMAQFNVKS